MFASFYAVGSGFASLAQVSNLGGLGYKDLRVQGLQQASRVSGEAAERAQYSLCYLL